MRMLLVPAFLLIGIVLSLPRPAYCFQLGRQPSIGTNGGINLARASIIKMTPGRHHLSTALAAETPSAVQFITNKRCPFAQKAWIALEVSGCPYDMREVSLYGAGGKPDWFWKLNPQGTVPVVVSDSNKVFADSELILDAIGEGRVKIQSSGDGEDVLLQTSELSEEEIICADQWRTVISKQLIPVGKSAVLGGSLPKLRSLLKELNGMVKGPYLAGDKITLADCAAFPFFWRIDQEYGIGGKNNNGEDQLRSWLDKCMDANSV